MSYWASRLDAAVILASWPRVVKRVAGAGRLVARASGHGPLAPGDRAVTDQPVVTAVSSTTNEVCSELSSVPENLMVTALPAKPASENECSV
jgi:hypothetical protein